MNLIPLSPSRTLNDAYRKQSLSQQQVELFKKNLAIFFGRIKDGESEENNKNIIADFLKDTYYKSKNEINTNERKDLVIHNGPKPSDTVGVIIEAKKPGNTAEMISVTKPNVKALHELVHYYLHERIYKNNTAIKHLIATNVYDWFIFDAQDFEKLFYQNKNLVKAYKAWDDGTLVGDKTDWLYNQLLKPFIEKEIESINAVYFNLKKIEPVVANADKADDEKLVDLYKILSSEHLLKQSFANDSNSLNKEFYNELLHIIGLEEKKEGSKKLIDRCAPAKRNEGSLLENTITILQSRSRTAIQADNIFSTALELCINWLNRILFLKLMEGQLIQYHRGDKKFAFLNNSRIKDFDELDELFFEVLALPVEKRSASVNTKFANIPYLNSSLFEPTENEKQYAYISSLKGRLELPVYKTTVLKNNTGKRIEGNKNSLHYLFEFLDAYDFASDKASLIKEDNKTIINASVLGLIFEKINGYKDGSFFTPGFITMYMCRETLRRAVVQKFKEAGGKFFENIEQYDELKDKIDYSDKTTRAKANELINSIKICDPAVGSGHFLVSALNEIIAIKSDLRILSLRNGNRCSSYKITVANDELIIKNVETDKFFAYLLNENNKPIEELQEVQEMLFHEKQTIIENCLFGVDINSKSVMICQLRLWIELLKNAYYIQGLNDVLETLPNIDINIRCGNSLISRFSLDEDLKPALSKSKFNIQTYKLAVKTYREAENKEQKHEMESLISIIKNDFSSELSFRNKIAKSYVKEKASIVKISSEINRMELWKEKISQKLLDDLEIATKKLDKLERDVKEIQNNIIYKNAFEWRFEFPEVLNDKGDFDGFDVVVGNPPYVSANDLKKSVSEQEYTYLKNNFETAKGTVDLYIYFFEKGLNLLNEKGNLSFITPNRYLSASYGEALREYLYNKVKVSSIIDYSNVKVFAEASTYPILTFLTKDLDIKSDDILIGKYNAITEEMNFKNAQSKKLSLIDGYIWGFLLNDKLPITEKVMKQSIPLSQVCKVNATSTTSEADEYGKIINEKNGYKLINTGTIDRYSCSWGITQLTDKGRKFLTPFLPKDSNIISKNRHTLYSAEKIILAKIAIRTEGFLDINGEYSSINTNCLYDFNKGISSKYILAWINSKLFQYCFECFFEGLKMQGGYLLYSAPNVLSLFVKELDSSPQLPFITLVDKILAAKKENPQADTSAWEKEIDALVYVLYGLTAEEIKMVEGR